MFNSDNFNSQITNLFNEIRSLLDKLEYRIKEREKQLKDEAKEELLHDLGDIYESLSNGLLNTTGKQRKQKDVFFQILKSRLEAPNGLNKAPDESHPDMNIVDESLRMKAHNTLPPNSFIQMQTTRPPPIISNEGITTMVVPVNPTSLLNNANKYLQDEEDAETFLPDLLDNEREERNAMVSAESKNRIKYQELMPVHPKSTNTSSHLIQPLTSISEHKHNHQQQLILQQQSSSSSSLILAKRRRLLQLQSKSANQCPICHQTFTQKNSLNRHVRSHTGEKPFPCQVCGKCFIDKERLKVHLRIHTGEKPFSCEVCGKRFSQKSTVKRHMSVHTGEKPYLCSVCNKAFGSKDNLKVHLGSHNRWDGYSNPSSALSSIKSVIR